MADIPEEMPEIIKTAIAEIVADEKILFVGGPYDRYTTPVLTLIITNKKIIFLNAHYRGIPKINRKPTGIQSITEYYWHDIAGVSTSYTSSFGVTLTMIPDTKITIDHLKRDEAAKVYSICTKMREVLSSGPGAHPLPQTPIQNLKYIKEMLDEGLITQAEYEAKKAELLSRI